MDKNITVPESMVSMLFGDANALHEMLAKLISMCEMESELKKHHKAYLHIRDEADELCKAYSCTMKTMQKRWLTAMIEHFGTDALPDRTEACKKQAEDSGVWMSTDSFENVLDDTLCLTECIDVLSDNLEGLVSILSLPQDLAAQYVNICNSTRAVADDVMNRWMELET